jgi:hypothetical protein
MARSGGRWRYLPARLGDYDALKRRYYRWIAMGVLEARFEALSAVPDRKTRFTAAAIADIGYDANHRHDKLGERGGEIVIPPKRNRKVQRSSDADLCTTSSSASSIS